MLSGWNSASERRSHRSDGTTGWSNEGELLLSGFGPEPSPGEGFDLTLIRLASTKEGSLASQPDIPRTHTVEPIQAPPDSSDPTTSMLKADINSGRTGDKNPVFDPGLSPLGTDDEAAGHPPSAFRVALARRIETVSRWSKGARATGAAHNKQDGFPTIFVGFIVAVGLVLVVGVWSV